MATIHIKNVLLDGKERDILIKGERIEKIASSIEPEKTPDLKVIDGSGKAVIPGFANMHTHAAMTMMRGAEEDSKLKDWLQAIWKMEAHLDDELVYYGTLLACVEMIKSGTTLYNDQYFYIKSAVKASNEMGLRSRHCAVFLDLGDKDRIMQQRESCQKMYEESLLWGDLATFDVGIHSIYTVSEENIIWAKEFARKHNKFIHLHLAETAHERLESFRKHRCSPIAYLNDLELFSKKVIAAHCCWIDENDVEVLGNNHVNIAHNINSNLKLSSGYKFKFQELESAGANICLGTDGVASSNNLDMLEAMKTTALVQKAWRKDPSTITLKQLIESATSNGYKAYGLNGGKIKEGALADLSLIDIDNIHFTPNINFEANLVYSTHSDCIKTVICNGRIIMENRYIEREREIIEAVRRLYVKLHKD